MDLDKTLCIFLMNMSPLQACNSLCEYGHFCFYVLSEVLEWDTVGLSTLLVSSSKSSHFLYSHFHRRYWHWFDFLVRDRSHTRVMYHCDSKVSIVRGELFERFRQRGYFSERDVVAVLRYIPWLFTQ